VKANENSGYGGVTMVPSNMFSELAVKGRIVPPRMMMVGSRDSEFQEEEHVASLQLNWS
jgi:hypothetical protein